MNLHPPHLRVDAIAIQLFSARHIAIEIERQEIPVRVLENHVLEALAKRLERSSDDFGGDQVRLIGAERARQHHDAGVVEQDGAFDGDSKSRVIQLREPGQACRGRQPGDDCRGPSYAEHGEARGIQPHRGGFPERIAALASARAFARRPVPRSNYTGEAWLN